jgi:putative endonuclease
MPNQQCFYVYILQSTVSSDRHYIGFTTDLNGRLSEHNAGKSPHTSKYLPWRIQTALAFTDKDKALEFEKYLKSHSGRAFAKKHF